MAEGKQQQQPKKQQAAQKQEQDKSAAVAEQAVLTGKVKWFNASRGYGFITPDNGDPDLFVHQTSIHASGYRSLRDGEVVEFTVEMGDDGRARACNVTGPQGDYVQGAPEEGYYANGGGNAATAAGGNTGAGAGGGNSGGGRGRGNTNNAGASAGAGRGRGNAGGGVCYSCQQPGHIARDCNKRGCYSCGVVGHLARDCTNQQS